MEYSKEIWTSQIKGKKKVAIVDKIFTELARMYDIPKPDYSIYKIVTVKKLDDTLNVMYSQFCTYRGSLRYDGRKEKKCFIILIMRSARVSKNLVLHEFGHYLDYVKNGYKPLDREEAEEKAEIFSRNRRVRRVVNRIIYEMNKSE